MRVILIPVKSFANAKQRLAGRLSLEQRASLARAMMEDVFEAVAGVRGAERIFVVSSEPQALSNAAARGWETFTETAQQSESASVDFASGACAKHGASAVLRLPADLPLVMPADLEALFAELPDPPAAVLVPSRDGTGTNALLRSPAVLFPSHFGPGSFTLHHEEAKRSGARARIVRNPRIEFDVDDPRDLADLPSQKGIGRATTDWLVKQGLQI
ncbi:MAG TPA: 2-phospho-L-lactate guanylyltransferase [Candidatus Acidoferrales bacterium]|nr:2-phospho-L-lactate guanylyltransferase [Candidatus Acidoferrales bacterium]